MGMLQKPGRSNGGSWCDHLTVCYGFEEKVNVFSCLEKKCSVGHLLCFRDKLSLCSLCQLENPAIKVVIRHVRIALWAHAKRRTPFLSRAFSSLSNFNWRVSLSSDAWSYLALPASAVWFNREISLFPPAHIIRCYVMINQSFLPNSRGWCLRSVY